MKPTLLAFLIPIFVAPFALGASQLGCNGQNQAAAPDALATVEGELGNPGIPEKDPPDEPPCRRTCVGKECGDDDGCGGTCLRGWCPGGQTCGGGGRPGVCACRPQCDGKACGEPDGCGGACNAGACPAGQGCSIFAPGQCSTIPIGQGVECFVFGDGYSSMAGPSGAIYFTSDGRACIPDGSPQGTCRKWWGRCRTTDASHTPVTFRGAQLSPLVDTVFWSNPSDAIFNRHHEFWFFSKWAESCLPNGTPDGECYDFFGGGQTPDGRAVRCRLFDDGGSSMTAPTNLMFDTAEQTVADADKGGGRRKWFGECSVGGCGDGICDPNESPATCSDCTCGNGVCDAGETAQSCARDCVRCGDGVCNGGENANNCAQDCVRCGDGVCNGGETCGSCSADCSCPRTCSGAIAGPSAQLFTVFWQDAIGCAGVSYPMANDLDEAKNCVGTYANVQTSAPSGYWFHVTPPGYSCRDIYIQGFSTDGARTCAQRTTGWDYEDEGPCP